MPAHFIFNLVLLWLYVNSCGAGKGKKGKG